MPRQGRSADRHKWDDEGINADIDELSRGIEQALLRISQTREQVSTDLCAAKY